MTIIARACWSAKPHPWHVWAVGWRRYLCIGVEAARHA